MLKSISHLVIIAAVFLGTVSVYAQQTSGSGDVAGRTQGARDTVRKYEAAGGKNVEVEMLDGTRHSGQIGRSDDASFDIKDGSGHTVTISYSDVKTVKRKSGFWTTKKAVLISAAAGGAIVLASIFLKYCRNEGGC